MKLLFTDLDGTLLTDDKRILDADMAAIEAMLSRGHKLVLCTGRPLTSAKQLAQKYGFDKPGFFLVSFNGGLIYDYATETEQLKTYCRLMKMDYVVVKDIREYYGEFINVVVKPPIKVNIITPFDHSSLVDFRAEMRKTTAGKLFDVFSKPEMLEFSHMQSNKGDAVRFMAEYYKVPLEDTIAVGDEENDCPMIEAACVGVAVANASPVAKAAADYVTANDNNHSAIAEVIEKFVLG